MALPKSTNKDIAVYRCGNIATAYYKNRRIVIFDPPDDLLKISESVFLTHAKDRSTDNARNFLISINLINESIANFTSNILRLLVPTKIRTMVLLVTMILICSIVTYSKLPVVIGRDAFQLPSSAFSQYVQVVLILFWHELGHAAAARKMGIRIDGFGAGIFLVFPSLFTKLSMVSRLDPEKKSVVFLSGIYFQQLISPILLLYGYQKQEYNLFYINILLCLMNLLPIFKLDGWRLATEFKYSLNKTNRWLVSAILNFSGYSLILERLSIILGHIRMS
jgi:Zn-dependent protease